MQTTSTLYIGQDQSTVAQQAETSVAECSWRVACELVCLIGSHTVPGQYSQPIPNCVGERVYACLKVTCHLHFWQNDHSLLCAAAVTQGKTDTE